MKKDLAATKVFLLAILVSYLAFSPFTLDLTLTPRFIGLSLFLLLAVYVLYKSGRHFVLKLDGILIAYLAYTLFCVLSVAWAHTASEAIFESAKALLSLFVFLFTVFALRQQAAYFSENLQKLSVAVFYLSFIAALYQVSTIKDFEDKDMLYVITGLNSHKNLYSSFLFLNLFFLANAFSQLKTAWRVFAGIAIVLSLLVLLLLKTKAVWIGLGVAGLTYLLLYVLRNRKLRMGLPLALVICLVAANAFFFFALPPLIQKSLAYAAANDKKPLLDQERLVIWEKTYYLVNQHPAVGVGMGNWQVNLPDATLSGLWRAEDLNYTFQRPHNDFLWILSETGFIGFNLFLLFLTWLLLLTVKTMRQHGYRYNVQSPAFALAFILGYFCISFFDFPKERMEHLVGINLLLGTCYYFICRHRQPRAIITLPVFKAGYILPLMVLGFTFIVGLLRHSGEHHTRELFNFRNQGRFQDIIKAGKSAGTFVYTLDPTSIPVCWYVGNAYVSTGNYLMAHRNFVKAYKLNPYNRNVLNDLGSSYVMLNQQDSAKICYLEAARISPRFDDPKLNLIAIYVNENDFKRASECIKTLYHDSERRSNYQKMIDAFKGK